MSLFAELKRRNVFRVVAMYAVLSWLLLQIADVVFSFLGVADSAGRILIAYLAIGFIPVVLFSWVYEITPEGVKLESEVDRSKSITSHTAKKLDLAVIVMLLVALGIFLVERFGGSSDPAEQAKEEQAPAASPAASQSTSELARSVAVLPFTDRSSEPDPNRFVDGIHDDLLTQLAKIAAIKVISRTSVMEYRDTTKNLRQIGEELGVATIMEGAVQRIGNRMRINAQLIDASSDEHLWAESYDRELTAANVFDIQTEIARAIAKALETTLSPSEEKQLERRGTDNLDALAAYQRARRLYDRYAFSQNQSAVEAELEHVLALDPNFVSAWAYLARSRLARWWAGSEDPADLEGAWEAIEKGRAIDPESAEIKIAQGYYHYWGSRSYQQALDVLIPVLEIVPNAVDLHEVVAFVYRRYGRFDKALEHLKRAHELDPRSITTGYSLGETHGLLRDFATAEAVLKRLEVFAPTSPRTYQLRAQILLGRDGDARAAARQYLVVIDDLFSFRVSYWQFLIQSQQFEAAMEAVDFGDVAYTDAWSYPVEMTRGLTDFHAGRLDQAEPNLEAALDQIEDRLVAKPAHSGHLNSRCILLGALGRQPEAIEACTTAKAQLVDDAYDRHFLQLLIATGLAMAGATDQALDLIEAGLAAEAGPTVNHYALDPGFKNLHELPRWQELIGSGPKTQ